MGEEIQNFFLIMCTALVMVNFCAFPLLWRLNWRAWWQFFLVGVVLGLCAPYVCHIVDVAFFGGIMEFTLLLDSVFAVWAGLEMLLIRWFCGIGSAYSTPETSLKPDRMKNFPNNYFPASVKKPMIRLLLALLVTPIASSFVGVLLLIIFILSIW